MKHTVTYRGGLPGASETVTLSILDNRFGTMRRYSCAIYNDADGALVGAWSPDGGTTWNEFYRQARPALWYRTGYVDDINIEALPYVRFQWENGAVAQQHFEVQQATSDENSPAELSDPEVILGASLELWLRSDRGITLASGAVSQWECPVTGRTFSQGTAANRPTYNASDANWGGVPSLTFDGTNDFLLSDDAASVWRFLHDGTGGGVFVVYRTDSTDINQYLVTTSVGAGAGARFLARRDTDAINVGIWNATPTAVAFRNESPAGIGSNHWSGYYYQHAVAGEDFELMVDGVNTYGAESAATPSAGDSTYSLYLGYEPAGGNAFVGEILEVIAFSVYPTAAQLTALQAYIERRYGLWTPASIFGDGLHTWLRSDDITGVADGGTVASWTDRSGNGHNFSQSTEANKPTYNASDSNWRGLPSLTFDGSNDKLISDEAAATWKLLHDGTGACEIVVCRAGADATMVGFATGNSTDVGSGTFRSGSDDSYRYRVMDGTTQLFNAATSANDFPINTNSWFASMYEEGRAGNEYALYANGTLRASGNSGVAPSAADPTYTLTLGSNPAASVDVFTGEILEVIIVSRYPTDSELTRLATYMEQRYGL